MPETDSKSRGRHRARFPVVRPAFPSPESVAARGALSLAEADALLSDGRLSNLWKLYRLGRSQVPHPDRVENASVINREWKERFQTNGVNEIPRFFKKHPEIAIWSTWVERALRRELSAMLTDAGFRDIQVKPTFGYYSIVAGLKP